jgi:hypothetical protein
MSQKEGRAFLRHTLATLAYRGGKAIRDAPAGFEAFAAGPATRTPAQILAHIGDVIEWGLSIASGKERWQGSTPRSWGEEVQRFFATLEAFDGFLASEEPLAVAPEKLFQGPVADAFTHVGQIAMLRRLAGGAVRGENYFRADIVEGRVGPEQAPPRREFD